MFKKILIANRGEIALRVISACRELGIQTVAIYSEADRDALHVRYADEDVCIGPYPSAASYLNISAIVSAAEITEADAIHPGYGFLSENAYFAEILQDCHIAFIGPSPEAIRKMGDKSLARRTVAAAGVPTVPGSPGAARLGGRRARVRRKGRATRSSSRRRRAAAAAGCAWRATSGTSPTPTRRPAREAEKAFGNAEVYLEKYLEEPRHIEFQVFGDSRGNRAPPRRARVLDPAPPPEAHRGVALGGPRRRAAAADGRGGDRGGAVGRLRERRHGRVPARRRRPVLLHGDEHAPPGRAPVTEEVTALDLVKEQIAVAAGEPLSFAERDMSPRGHAIEFRINAEDPVTFAPSPGRIAVVPPARRPRRARRHGGLPGVPHPAVLRLADRQAHRVGARPRGGDRRAGAGRSTSSSSKGSRPRSRSTAGSSTTRTSSRAASRRTSWSDSPRRAEGAPPA